MTQQTAPLLDAVVVPLLDAVVVPLPLLDVADADVPLLDVELNGRSSSSPVRRCPENMPITNRLRRAHQSSEFLAGNDSQHNVNKVSYSGMAISEAGSTMKLSPTLSCRVQKLFTYFFYSQDVYPHFVRQWEGAVQSAYNQMLHEFRTAAHGGLLHFKV